VVTDLVADATTELYRADPDEFTARRTALAKAARTSGDPAAAKSIAALRKPTRAAWVLNRLVRARPEVPAQLSELANGLGEAERTRDGARLRELSAARSALLDEFTARALDDVQDPPASLRDDVAATLSAAIADPEVAADLTAGTLTRAAHWAGFGTGVPLAPVSDDAPASAPDPERAPRKSAPSPTPAPTRKPEAAPTAALREAEDRNRRRQQILDTERAVANASAIASSAAANEERLEDVVRDLEQRLTAARAELSEARLRARRAEAAERKARQALEHLSSQK
jgi:hypothetical protein